MNDIFSKYFKHRSHCNVLQDLMALKDKRKEEDLLLDQVRSIVHRSMMNTKNVLSNLDIYQRKDFFIDDEEMGKEKVFLLKEIEEVCVKYRLNFLDIRYFKKEVDKVAKLKVEYLNERYKKQLTGFKIISYRDCFVKSNASKDYGILFAPTLDGHYYFVYQWGKSIPKSRKWLYFPLRSFETIALFVIIFTLIVDLILPTEWITLDRTATYWCGYRLGVFFHLLIFFGGLTMFIVIGFFKNVSKNIWNVI